MPSIFPYGRSTSSGVSIITIAAGHYGIAIKMINGTGAPSVKGTLVCASKTEDGRFALQANEFDTIGIVSESGIEDGAECLVTIAGVAEVLWKDSNTATRGYIAIAADTDGRAVNVDVPTSNPVVAEHFKEIGHVLESKGSGTNVLVRCILHFN